MNLEKIISEKINEALKSLYNLQNEFVPTIQKTRPEFEGEFTLVVFPYLKFSGKNPEQTGIEIGECLIKNSDVFEKFNVIKGFLNLSLKNKLWIEFFNSILSDNNYGIKSSGENAPNIMIEYPSPNTNKPLHLGHLRNIFLGDSISRILRARGNNVIHSCLYNDRGTNISKSMLAWKLFANEETPETTGKKPDHFVGDYYVKYANEFKSEIENLISTGLTKEQAEAKSNLNQKVNDMTVAWENGDFETRELWKKMNGWVYSGFETTYTSLGIKPDKFYYESDVYNLGKETVQEGLEKGVFFKKADGSVWIDLTNDGLDEKVVLRANGTSVYITQDIATANEKDRDYKLDKSIYVVGNEQDYHFKVLFLILKKLGRKYADNLFHLSYGMVELPTGKMKSREGTVVDADDLINEVIAKAEEKTRSQGKVDQLDEAEKKELFRVLGLGALKYFILKVDPKKKMVFNPDESVDLNGNTGPFIQYAHARIRSVLSNSGFDEISVLNFKSNNFKLNNEELNLLRLFSDFTVIIKEAEKTYSPALLANYSYELAKAYNHFYHEHSILKAADDETRLFRLALSLKTGKIIKLTMGLLGINMPERM
ncbi:MAG: arginine--tRNA ligase [Bacteroidota bacterium]|jgi:arginyl-tRNA synthetase